MTAIKPMNWPQGRAYDRSAVGDRQAAGLPGERAEDAAGLQDGADRADLGVDQTRNDRDGDGEGEPVGCLKQQPVLAQGHPHVAIPCGWAGLALASTAIWRPYGVAVLWDRPGPVPPLRIGHIMARAADLS